eukprot:c16943_g1_i2.p1 GENE.c16943_g1_i2~~c16943_g1_i2.p1  ORF type:complete len:220 (+),score=101.46 c16943_g1_i2:65-724(+)
MSEKRERESEVDVRSGKEQENNNHESKRQKSEIEKKTEDTNRPKPLEIDREKTCPLLLRVFCNSERPFGVEDYENLEQKLKTKEMFETSIHTWKDATLRELTDLLKEVNPDVQEFQAKLIFSIVFPNKRGELRKQEIGMCWSNPSKTTETSNKTLAELKFETGDYLDVFVSLPSQSSQLSQLSKSSQNNRDRGNNQPYRSHRNYQNSLGNQNSFRKETR